MFSGEISKNGKDGWAAISIASLDALQVEHSQSWVRKGDRIKKVRKLDARLFNEFFTPTVTTSPPSATVPEAAPAPPASSVIPDSAAPPLPKKNPSLPVSTPAGDGPANSTQLAEVLVKGFRESLEGLGHDIGTALTHTVRADLTAALDANSARLHAALAELAQTIGRTNFESAARALAEKFFADLRVKADGLLIDIEKSAGKTQASATETRDGLEKLREDFEKRLQALRHLQGDVSEDSADLIERIKKFGLGHVQVLEQQNAQLRKELDQARSEQSRLHSELTQEKLARGHYDPALFERMLKENSELSTAKVELERTRVQLANAVTELADLRPLRTAKLDHAQNVKELSELREWKQKHQPELDRANDRAKAAGEEIRRLEKDRRDLAARLRELDEDRRSIQELKETSESYRIKASNLEARCRKLEASEAKAQEKAAALGQEVAEGREAYKRDVQAEHARQLLQSQQRHGEELAQYVGEVDRLSEDVAIWQGQAQVLDARIKEIEEDHALGLRERYQKLMRDYTDLLTTNDKRKQDIASENADLASLKEQVTLFREHVAQAQQRAADLKAEAVVHQEQLKRYKEEQQLLDARREEQKRQVFRPQFERVASETQLGEWDWLQYIHTNIKAAGFHFNRRLLYAFHTALKAQDISPLTLLAGISGTGKSELPRLYADAGGILFLPVTVQPNWDSPADLFGFYNYTEGVFHSTPLCRAMRQFTQEDHAAAMHDRMLMVLLDEMNLARVEYYFSDLLSRLEIRRGILRLGRPATDDEWRRASIELNLGEGDPAWLRLGDNVLFVGTLNEDETTLGLSPKVVDRANTITFPKPSSFVDMNSASHEFAATKDQLPRARWSQWCTANAERKLKAEGELRPKFDAVSSALEKVGRGVGQRVFQAALRYVALYPVGPDQNGDGMQAAIEDQFAMKLIPKLKGVDTRSKQGRECLELFKAVVPERLRSTFDAAASEEREIFDWRGADHMFAVERES
jgi:hypothetical protein